MKKEYYNIKLKDGNEAQVWDVEKVLAFSVALKSLKADPIILAGYFYAFARFCDVFEYVARAGRKDIKTKEEDRAKAKDNLQQIEDKEFLSFMIEELCKMTDIGEEIRNILTKSILMNGFND